MLCGRLACTCISAGHRWACLLLQCGGDVRNDNCAMEAKNRQPHLIAQTEDTAGLRAALSLVYSQGMLQPDITGLSAGMWRKGSEVHLAGGWAARPFQ